MIDLRFVEREGKRVLQWRKIALQIGWSKGDDTPVIQPANPISLRPEKNWSEWEDVRFEQLTDAHQDTVK